MTGKRGGGGDPHTVNIVSGNVFGSVIQAGTISGGVHVHSGEPPVVPVVTSVVARDSAPYELFVGRVAQVEELLAGLAPEGDGRAVVVSAGMGGVGKTALARHAAAIAVQRRWFTGAALLVDLRGYDPDGRAVASEDVFAPLLRMLGVEAKRVPETRAEQAAVYHQTLDRMARQGRRVLLVLDNASSGDQVRNLLPRQSAHRVLVTTRDRMSVPGSRTLVLEELPLREARVLLEEAVHEQLPEDTRIGDNPELADRLVRACGALPLALRIVAAILADEPDLPLTALVDELRQGGDLRHGELSVAGSFDASWRRLLVRDPSAARLGWLCTLHPGPVLDTEAARALDGRTEAEVRAGLRTLLQAHLLGRSEGRWRLHDLVRQHLAAQSLHGLTDEPADALARLLEHYLAAARTRDAQWFERERVNLLAAVPAAAAAGMDRLAAELAAAVRTFLTERSDLPVHIFLSLHEVDAAGRFADAGRRAQALLALGRSLAAAGRFSEGLSYLEQSLKLWRSIGDEESIAHALRHLGNALTNARRFPQAASAYRESAQRFRALGSLLAEATVLGDLAIVLTNPQDPDEALAAAHRSAALYAASEDRFSELNLRAVAATIHFTARQYHEAIVEAEAVAELARDEGHTKVEARACTTLAAIYGQSGQERLSIEYRNRALQLCRQSGDEDLEASLMNRLSIALTFNGDVVDAAAAMQKDVDYHRSVGDKNGEGEALNRLGLMLSDRTQHSAAYQVHQKAVEVWRELGNRYREGAELAALAKAYAAVQRMTAARRAADEAVEALTDSGAVDEAEKLRAWAQQLPAGSVDEPEELLHVTTIAREKRRGGCVQLLTIVGVVVAAVVGAPWWMLAGWALLLGGLRTTRALVTGPEQRDSPVEQQREPLLEAVFLRVEGCVAVFFITGLALAYFAGGPSWLLAVCTVLAGCWVSGKHGVVVFLLIGALVVHFGWGTWWVAAGLVAPFLGYLNTMGPADETRKVEVG
ncbi:tetratricopeptide repeat protein [Streptomyces sp. enrichment culture]|uniref:tetratricopeptide repeat protein n=1 Tax=Streptomyces sp. enrichment culture TaxID=1795815 RepID=UPI003F57197D